MISFWLSNRSAHEQVHEDSGGALVDGVGLGVRAEDLIAGRPVAATQDTIYLHPRPAFVVAESILTLFTTVSPKMDGDKQVKSRTAVAVETALANLEDSFVLKHGGAIDLGKKRAFAALSAGFDNKSKPVVTAPTEV